MVERKYVIFSQILLSVIHYSSACQGLWILNTNDLEDGNVISFKNTTIIGKLETLTWMWSDYNSNQWENKVSRSLQDGNMKGSLIYRSTRHGEKKRVGLSWSLEGKQFSSINADKEIFNSQWTLNVCQGLSMKFRSNKDGSWEFKVDDYVIRSNEDKFLSVDQKSTTVRRKRTPQKFEVDDQSFRNVTETDNRGIFEYINNFFFGEGDPTTGENEGVFTRMKKWIQRMACQLRGNCDDNFPSDISYSPPITLPPFIPDSESYTEYVPGSSEDIP